MAKKKHIQKRLSVKEQMLCSRNLKKKTALKSRKPVNKNEEKYRYLKDGKVFTNGEINKIPRWERWRKDDIPAYRLELAKGNISLNDI